jgi:hypothetical protein
MPSVTGDVSKSTFGQHLLDREQPISRVGMSRHLRCWIVLETRLVAEVDRGPGVAWRTGTDPLRREM